MERSDEKLKQRGGLTLIAFIVLTLLGGANAVAVRFSNAELPPLWGATIRLVLAAAIVWVIVWVRRLPLPRGKAAVGAVLYGLLSFGGFLALMYLGLVHIGAGLASVVLALVPLLTLFFAFAHGLEPFRWRGLLGGLLAVAGIALAFFEQPNGNAPLLSLLAVAGAAAAMAEGSVLVKRFPQGDPMATNAVGMTAGAVVLLLLSVIMGEGRPLPVQTATWYAVFYLVVPGGVVVFSLFLYVLKRWTGFRDGLPVRAPALRGRRGGLAPAGRGRHPAVRVGWRAGAGRGVAGGVQQAERARRLRRPARRAGSVRGNVLKSVSPRASERVAPMIAC